jgi:hypothetical protein
VEVDGVIGIRRKDPSIRQAGKQRVQFERLFAEEVVVSHTPAKDNTSVR